MRDIRHLVDGMAPVPTPALVIDGPKVRENVASLAAYAASVRIKVRPHTKTHKQRHFARMQLAAGASGLTVAKVGEAESITEPEQDVLIAYPPVGEWRADRIATLACSRTVRVALDSLAAVELLSTAAARNGSTVGVLVDIDVGLGRTGVQIPEQSLSLAQAVDRLPNVRLDGIMIYPGHISAQPAEQGGPMRTMSDRLQASLDLWKRHGLSAPIVSGGSTPTAYQSHLAPEVTEIRPGTYIFNDMNTVRGGYLPIEDCAAFVIATVVSNAVPNQIVVDAGSKALAKDASFPKPEMGFGHVVELPDARIDVLSEEHAQIDTSQCDKRPAVGDRLSIIPNHICPCVNLQDAVWLFEPGEPLRELPVDARGKLQ